MSESIDKVIAVINDVAKNIELGDTFVREIRAQEMLAVWTNTRTRQEYYIQSRTTSRLVDYIKRNSNNDPRIIPCLQFIANQITATEAKKTIDRLEKLKAFW